MGGTKYEIRWNPINLPDEKGQAEARKITAEAVEKELNPRFVLCDMGVIPENIGDFNPQETSVSKLFMPRGHEAHEAFKEYLYTIPVMAFESQK